ncbi:MAG: sulfatase-like hydrolase/transferase [Campylobacterales bacterium]|nr:sulfatase-like hydrolase/transferase [Campylobacterales bacterium]
MQSNFKIELQNIFYTLLKHFLLFLLFIETFRTIFVVYYWDKLQVASNPYYETILAYYNALSLDIASASILIVIPWLILTINSLVKSKYLKALLFVYTLGVLLISTFIYIIELGIYNEWEEKPTFKIFNYLKHPDEAIASNPILLTILLTVIMLIVFGVFYKLTKSLYSSYKLTTPRNYFATFLIFLLAPLIFLGARGGYKEIPISQASVYFSKHKVFNDLAISTVYNFGHSITENQVVIDGINHYAIDLEEEKKEKILQELMATTQGAPRESFLSTERPNVVLIFWESLAGDFINTTHYQEVIPNFMKLSKNGILFTNAYSSATLSHEGLPSVLSGWPAIEGTYMTNLPSKFYKLPFLTQSLKESGYTSMFLFGGQLRYGNLTSYMYGNGFDIIEENSNINLPSEQEGVLGYHDGYMMQYLVQKTSQLKEPFFSSMFTLSSHSPYDQPMKDVIEWGDSDKGYLNSVYYTDKSLGEFFESAKKEPWYKNTLFIIVADHSHHTPFGWQRHDPRWHHIPMMFYGDVIKQEYRGYQYEKIASQRDIAATLLSQMNLDHSKFIWSRDLFADEYKPSAYILVDNGFGFITPEGNLSYDLRQNRVLLENGKADGLRIKGNVYMEKLLQTYLDY